MKEKKIYGTKVLKELISYLTMCLEELTQIQKKSAFCEGIIIAYVECLEIVSKWTKYEKFGIKDIEKIFPIK